MRSSYEKHLNQEGVELARSVGMGMGPFQRVVTSTLPRAFETAIAMGFAVDEQNDLMSSYGMDVETEAPWPCSFAEYSNTIRKRGAVARYAQQLKEYYQDLMKTLPENGSALVINHGGVVEIGVVGCLPEQDFSSWGDAVGYCEGARIEYEKGMFLHAVELRIHS